MKNVIQKSWQLGEKWGITVIKHRWKVLITSLLFFVVFASGGIMQLNSDYHIFFSEDNPQLIAYDELQAIYSKDDNVFIAIERKDGNSLFDPESLQAIEDLTNKAWQTPYSSRVDGITNFQFTKAVGDDLYVEDLVSNAVVKNPQELAAIKEIATSDNRLVNRLINKEGTVTGINITVKLPGGAPEQNDSVTAYVRKMVSEFEKENPQLKTSLTGFVMLTSAFYEAAFNDGITLTPLMFLVIILITYITTRTITGTLSTLLIIILSIGTAMGAGAYMGIYLTPPTAAFANIIMTLAIANCIHILITFIQSMRTGMDKKASIVESLRINFSPVLATMITTVIGFLSMNFSDSPPFRDLGNLTAIGMIAVFIYAIGLLPALLSILPVKIQVRKRRNGTKWFEKFSEFVISNRRPVFIICAAFVVISSVFVVNNDLNDDFVKYFSKNIQFRTDTDHISQVLTGMYTMEFSINAGEPGGVNNPGYLHKLHEFEKWLYKNPEVIHVNAFTDVMRHINKSMHGDNINYFKIPEKREEAAQYLLLYEMSLPFGLDMNNQVNVDKSATRVIVTLENIPFKKMIQLSEKASQWLDDNAPDYMNASATSNSLMFAHLTQRQIHSMITGTILAMVLIAIVIGIVLRNFRLGLLSLIPNITPVIAGLGLWGLFFGYFNTGMSIVFGMTLGIIVDDTVHFLSKYLRARKEHSLSSEESIQYAFTTVGKAIIVTSVILLAGFGILALSNFGMNSDMAKITMLIIFLALVLDFLLLPVMLLTKKSHKKVNTPAYHNRPFILETKTELI